MSILRKTGIRRKKAIGIGSKGIKRSGRRLSASKGKEKSISKLVKELDAVFSKFIRYSRADQNQRLQCYTCGYETLVKKIHAGHYISRWYKKTRWNENNVRPQCYLCNIYKKGDAANFRKKLVKEIGEPAVKEMEDSIHNIERGLTDRFVLEREIEVYKNLLKNLPQYQKLL